MSAGGNEGVRRQNAVNRLNDAKRNGVSGKTLGTLQADLDAAVAAENSAKGTPGQRRY